jgi:hypothetical protein
MLQFRISVGLARCVAVPIAGKRGVSSQVLGPVEDKKSPAPISPKLRKSKRRARFSYEGLLELFSFGEFYKEWLHPKSAEVSPFIPYAYHLCSFLSFAPAKSRWRKNPSS